MLLGRLDHVVVHLGTSTPPLGQSAASGSEARVREGASTQAALLSGRTSWPAAMEEVCAGCSKPAKVTIRVAHEWEQPLCVHRAWVQTL